VKTTYIILSKDGESLRKDAEQLEPYKTYSADLIEVCYSPNTDPEDPSEDEMTLTIRLKEEVRDVSHEGSHICLSDTCHGYRSNLMD
jgi:hypothetical protein